MTLFDWTLMINLFHNTLVTLSVTPPCNMITPTSHLTIIKGFPILYYIYTASPYLWVRGSLWQIIRLSTRDVILAQLLTYSSLKTQGPSSISALENYFFLLSSFSFILLLYLSGLSDLAGFTLSGFGTARPCFFIF